MKKLMIMLLLSVLFCGSINAQDRKFRPAIIVKTDGTKMECVARYPYAINAKFIEYKANTDSRQKQKLKSDSIRTALYYLDNDLWVELDHYLVKDMQIGRGNKKERYYPLFMNVVSRGPVTLYKNTSAYYCKRAGEEFASTITLGAGVIGSNFKKVAGDYFADYPVLAEKIRNGENGYNHPHYIKAIVEEYNAGKAVE